MSAYDSKIFLKVLGPRLFAKALASLDQSTAILVGICWLVALVILIAALISVHSVVLAKKEAADAIVSEPVLPETSASKIGIHEAQTLVDRLQHQFPDVKFDVDGTQALIIKCDDGTKFHEWISALSYVDTIAPQYRWNLNEFCVGHCNGSDLMKAVVTGQKITFTPPQHKD